MTALLRRRRRPRSKSSIFLTSDKKSRVLQFSGYSFDLSVFDHLVTLVVGGCVCIPSENDRRSNLVRAAKQLQPNWTFLTPSVARIMRPKDFPVFKRFVWLGRLHWLVMLHCGPIYYVSMAMDQLSVRCSSRYSVLSLPTTHVE